MLLRSLTCPNHHRVITHLLTSLRPSNRRFVTLHITLASLDSRLRQLPGRSLTRRNGANYAQSGFSDSPDRRHPHSVAVYGSR
jgi:hypothetical protein